MSVQYRRDIDGLRAIAVLAVFIYHLFPNWMQGGYIGVDVFFVISGFLITSNVHDEIEQGRFTFAGFYQRRVRRILPAFYVLAFVTALFAAFLFLPADLIEMQRSWKSALFFVSNFFFQSRNDYFSNNVFEMPLLHTWSLSVEEQFYFIWPAFVLGFYTLGAPKRFLTKIIVGLSLASIFLGQYYLSQPDGVRLAYYSFLTRFGELLIGAFLAEVRPWMYGVSEKVGSRLRDLGLLMIVASCFAIRHRTPFPGWVVLVPTLGAAFVLIGGRFTRGWTAVALSSKTMVGVGLISYSLYLWHWPILAFFRYFLAQKDLPLGYASVAAVLAFLFAFLSWKYVEQPYRKKTWSPARTLSLLFVVPAAVSLLACVAIDKADGLSFRYSDREKLKRETEFLSPEFRFGDLGGNHRYGDRQATPRAFLFGDSNAGHFMGFWDELGKQKGFSWIGYAADRCYPLLDVDGHKPSTNSSIVDPKCPQLIAQALDHIKSAKVVILAGAWSGYIEDLKKPEFLSDLEATIAYLARQKKMVVVMEQAPLFPEAPFQRYLRTRFALLPNTALEEAKETFLSNRSGLTIDANRKVQEIVRKYPGAYFMKTTTLIQDKGFPVLGDDLCFMNATHLSEFGSRRLAQEVGERALKEAQIDLSAFY